jgi:hypothetical protein
MIPGLLGQAKKPGMKTFVNTEVEEFQSLFSF